MQNTMELRLRTTAASFAETFSKSANEFFDVTFYESLLEQFMEHLRRLEQSLRVARWDKGHFYE